MQQKKVLMTIGRQPSCHRISPLWRRPHRELCGELQQPDHQDHDDDQVHSQLQHQSQVHL